MMFKAEIVPKSLNADLTIKRSRRDLGTYPTPEKALEAICEYVVGRYVSDFLISNEWESDGVKLVDFGSTAYVGRIKKIK